ncbi:MAG TPA: MoxR family ATPase [Actinomycetota bacterium]|nr:MoxR family ATPase [Actinomycetota bacterium]
MSTIRTRSAPRKRKAESTNGSRGRKALGPKEFKILFDELADNVESVVRGKGDVVRLALVAILAEGHVLFEDVPGTGKTVLARSIAQSMNASLGRIQCTPDMLPGDITGSSIYNQREMKFEFQPGPVFANVLLADEINRATPKTQSALLEAMAERRVSADGVTYNLPRPFLVLATQNPVEQAGTFPLPEAQLDRFLFRLSMGYMQPEAELDVVLANSKQLAIESLGAVADVQTVQQMIDYAADIEISPEVGRYIVDLVGATRAEPALALGASPRASIALVRASRVLAASDGREDVYPDDVLAVLAPVLNHRVVVHPDFLIRGETVEAVVERVRTAVKPPSRSKATAG